ncbi:MAG: general secretion pathway protein GspK, partial [Armatimonadetes bacterium]|nr:general secretion pathway protein GspK [Armatimonadota bacterium]
MRSQRGAVLIMTLVALTGLIAMVATFAATQRTSFQSRHNRLDQMRAEQMVDAGVQRALAELSIVDGSQPTTLQDDWAALGTLGDEKFIVGNGSFRIELVDGSSRIDLNSAPAEQLTKLNLTTEQIDSLLDWREAGQNPRQEGAKDEYYNTMTTPYNAALAPFKTVEELLLVKGFTGRSLYEIQDQTTSDQVLVSGDTQEPVLADLLSVGASSKRGNIPNIRTAPNLQAILRIVPNVQVATAVFNGRQGFNTTADMLRVAGMTVQIAQNLLDSYTVNPPNGDANDAGRLNINTATEAVLNSLPESTPDLTDAILQQQATG